MKTILKWISGFAIGCVLGNVTAKLSTLPNITVLEMFITCITFLVLIITYNVAVHSD